VERGATAPVAGVIGDLDMFDINALTEVASVYPGSPGGLVFDIENVFVILPVEGDLDVNPLAVAVTVVDLRRAVGVVDIPLSVASYLDSLDYRL
jgi:hypothetical protein